MKHLYSAPYHPSSNGQAERMVRTFKESVKSLRSSDDMEAKLCSFLFRYRITPQSATGFSPAELLFGRRLRSAMTLLKPDHTARMKEKRLESISQRKLRSFNPVEPVWVKNFSRGDGWLPENNYLATLITMCA